jgi:hypothetical protein
MDALTLSGYSLTEQSAEERTFWAMPDNDTENRFEVVSLEQTGKTATELLRLFKVDMKQDWPGRFEHPMLTVNAEVRDFQDLPMYFHGLKIHEDTFLLKGTERRAGRTDYFLILANAEGRFTSFAKFSLSIESMQSLYDYDQDMEEDDLRTVELNIHLDSMYTRCRFRGRGASSALAEAVAKIVDAEVLLVSAQLKAFHERTGIRIRVVPNLMSTWSSKTGLMAHIKVEDALNNVVDYHLGMLREEPARRAVELLRVDDERSDYA